MLLNIDNFIIQKTKIKASIGVKIMQQMVGVCNSTIFSALCELTHMQDQKLVKLPCWIVESVHSLVIMVQPTLHSGL